MLQRGVARLHESKVGAHLVQKYAHTSDVGAHGLNLFPVGNSCWRDFRPLLRRALRARRYALLGILGEKTGRGK